MPPPLLVAGVAARKSALLSARKMATKKRLRGNIKKAVKKRRQPKALSDDRPEILSPEGIAMMFVAVLFDLIPPVFILLLDILLGAGELISWPLDILATIILGGWMWIRGGEMAFGKKLTKYLKRRAPLILGEYIPIVGSFVPFWTINVFLFLKK